MKRCACCKVEVTPATIVAECWTCITWKGSPAWELTLQHGTLVKAFVSGPRTEEQGYATILLTESGVQKHRAAGHDVREVSQ